MTFGSARCARPSTPSAKGRACRSRGSLHSTWRCGESLSGKDLDNLVHGFLIPFEEKLCVARGTVASYRAYEAVGEPHGIQVRVLDESRLLTLEICLARARSPTAAERLLEALERRRR